MAFQIPSEVVQKIKQETDIIELIEELAPTIEWQNFHGGIYGAQCPHPNHKDENPSFRVWHKEQSWACMKCHNGRKTKSGEQVTSAKRNYGSDVIAFVRWYKGFGYEQAIQFLAKRIGIPLKEEDPNIAAEYDNNNILMRSFEKGRMPFVEDYLQGRGITIESINRWHIGWDGKRVTFPLLNRFNKVIGFTKRIFLEDPTGKQPKYRNSKSSPAFQKRKFLYGENEIDRSQDYVFITEGPVDVILPKQYGVKNVVAPLGTAFTEDHAKLIKSWNLTPVIMTDGDEAGINAAHKIANLFQEMSVSCLIVPLSDGNDLADTTLREKENISEYIDLHMMPYSMFCMKETLMLYEAGVQRLKQQLFPQVIKAASYVKDPNEKHLLADMLYDKMGVTLR